MLIDKNILINHSDFYNFLYLNYKSFNELLPDILYSYSFYFRRRDLTIFKPFNMFKNIKVFELENIILDKIEENSIIHKDIIENFYFKYISNKNEFLNNIIKHKYRNHWIVKVALLIQSESILNDHLNSPFKDKIISNFVKCHRTDFYDFWINEQLNPVFISLFHHINNESIDYVRSTYPISEHSKFDESIQKIRDYIELKNNIKNF